MNLDCTTDGEASGVLVDLHGFEVAHIDRQPVKASVVRDAMAATSRKEWYVVLGRYRNLKKSDLARFLQ